MEQELFKNDLIRKQIEMDTMVQNYSRRLADEASHIEEMIFKMELEKEAKLDMRNKIIGAQGTKVRHCVNMPLDTPNESIARGIDVETGSILINDQRKQEEMKGKKYHRSGHLYMNPQNIVGQPGWKNTMSNSNVVHPS